MTIVSAVITTYSAVKTRSYSEKIEEYSKKISNEYAAESLTIASQYTRQAKEEYYSLKNIILVVAEDTKRIIHLVILLKSKN